MFSKIRQNDVEGKGDLSAWRLALGAEVFGLAFGDLARNIGAILRRLAQEQRRTWFLFQLEKNLTDDRGVVKNSNIFS